jgi:hypothetical protein
VLGAEHALPNDDHDEDAAAPSVDRVPQHVVLLGWSVAGGGAGVARWSPIRAPGATRTSVCGGREPARTRLTGLDPEPPGGTRTAAVALGGRQPSSVSTLRVAAAIPAPSSPSSARMRSGLPCGR